MDLEDTMPFRLAACIEVARERDRLGPTPLIFVTSDKELLSPGNLKE